MTAWSLLLALALGAESDHGADAGVLPACGNRVIAEVTGRAGCTVGDARCWSRSGGFCTDYVEARLLAASPARRLELKPVPADAIRAGDVAVFASRAHYALVERVNLGRDGHPVSMDVAEFNFGSCWVDKDVMVTDRYKSLGRREKLPLASADGGFLRARPVTP